MRNDIIIDKYKKQYLKEILPLAVEIFKGYVPIDTRALQSAINYYNLQDYGIVQVDDTTLDYSVKKKRVGNNAPFEVNETMEARALAHILEVGTGIFKDGKRPLFRSQNNVYTKAGESTKLWWNNASKKVQELCEQKVQKYIKLIIDKTIINIFKSNGWEHR